MSWFTAGNREFYVPNVTMLYYDFKAAAVFSRAM